MNLRRLVVVLVLSLGFGIGTCKAQEITIAAAADLQFVMQDVAARFQKETGKTVKLIYGSSGKFFQKNQKSGPLYIFFFPNLDFSRKIKAARLTPPRNVFYD